jgi:nucleoside transporter
MKLTIRIQLSVMMFLEFFIWGAWFVTLGTYLGSKAINASGTEIATAYLSQSIGAVIAPFIVGLIADRYFSAQKILGVLHIAGAILLWMVSNASDYNSFLPLIMTYMVIFMPTLALVNSVGLRQMTDPNKQFPSIRVLGTLGWILAGVIIGWLGWEHKDDLTQLTRLHLTFKMAAAAAVVLGLYSFSLPATPPLKKGQKTTVGDILGLDAIKLLKDRSYLIFFLASIAICIPLSFYYTFTNQFLNDTGMTGAAGKQSLGQVSEVLFMILMPLFFTRLGVKKMLGLGMLAWVIRYIFFAYGYTGGNEWMLLAGILLHGICFDFFFVTGQIYTDNHAGARFQSAAQGFITLATYGLGMLIGTILSGRIVDAFELTNGQHNWKMIWLIPAGIALVVLVLFVLLFKNDKKKVIVA